jgi:hypothetical protein
MRITTMLKRAVMAIALGGTLAISGATVSHGVHMMPISGTCPTCVGS